MNRLDRLTVIIITLMFAAGFMAYPYLPDLLVSRWTTAGTPYVFIPKPASLFIIPLLSTALFLGFFYLREAIINQRVRAYVAMYEVFIMLLIGVLAAIDLTNLIWNLGGTMPIGRIVSSISAVIFVGALSSWYVHAAGVKPRRKRVRGGTHHP